MVANFWVSRKLRLAACPKRRLRARKAEYPVVPTANLRRLTVTADRPILAPDERPLQVDLVCPDRTVPVAGCVDPPLAQGISIPQCRGSNPAAPASQSVSNASHMKGRSKPRGTARFRRYERVSVCGIWQWRRHSCLLSQRDFFWCLVRLASDQVSDVGTSGSGHSTISGRFSPADNPRCLSSVWISSSWSRSGETELLL
jgi:hypothetical protein